MTRRDILKYTSLLTGAAVGAPLMSTILSGCQETATTDSGELIFFNQEDFNLVTEIVDIILPKTDSPSATEVGVHHLIDKMVGEVYNPEDQKKYQEGFTQLKSYLNDKSDVASGLTDLMADNGSDAQGALLSLRQQTIAFYLSTEVVSMNYLNYLPVPGEYEGCISLESVNNKAWA